MDRQGEQLRVIVVGAGFGGIAATVQLLEHGFTEVVVLDAAEEPGGTWHFNRYPGAACDVPSHLYSFSYAQRSEWSRFCSPGPEILAYLQSTARERGVTSRVVTGVHVEACEWDEDTCRWIVHGTGPDGPVRHEGDALVLATGQLNQPAYPRLDGREGFAGRSFHSARWPDDYDPRGKRMAVIGTGASAVQFVPELAEVAAHLTVFQRTGNWFLPRKNHAYAAWLTTLFARIPTLRRTYRAGLFWLLELLTAWIRHPRTIGLIGRTWSALFMRGQLGDPEVRRRAWPDYPFGCKRVLFSSSFLPALQRPNVELVTTPIRSIGPDGPRTADGRTHPVDCIVYGTGFRTTEFMFPMRVAGVGGRTLDEAWADGARAHLGICMPGFPSLFVMYGPNTNTSGGSIIFFLEAQARYVRRALQLLVASGAQALDVRPEALAAEDAAVQARFAGTAWMSCNSWYRDRTGRNVANWPGYMVEYAWRTRRVDPAQFRLIRAAPHASEAATVPSDAG